MASLMASTFSPALVDGSSSKKHNAHVQSENLTMTQNLSLLCLESMARVTFIQTHPSSLKGHHRVRIRSLFTL